MFWKFSIVIGGVADEVDCVSSRSLSQFIASPENGEPSSLE